LEIIVRRYCCAICQREVEYDAPLPALYPFCSPRCKMVDLGRWFREEYYAECAGPAAPGPSRGDAGEGPFQSELTREPG